MPTVNRRTRRMILAAVLLLIALSTPMAEASHSEVFITYFSNATYTTIVGGSHLDCDGNSNTWGMVTNFKQIYKALCPHS